MLFLSRRVTERIKIGENIYIEIVKVSGKCVTVGIDAPQSVAIKLDRTLGTKKIKPASQDCDALLAQDRVND